MVPIQRANPARESVTRRSVTAVVAALLALVIAGSDLLHLAILL